MQPTMLSPGLAFQTIHHRFEAQAERVPNHLAIDAEGRRYTFRNVNRRANVLARRLRALGVARDVPVGLWCKRSPDFVVGLLAVLKAGGAYMALDPQSPIHHVAAIVTDARATVLLTTSETPTLVGRDVTLVRLDEQDASTGGEYDAPGPAVAGHPDDIAVIVYTSGSTGKPKGIQIPHRAILARVEHGYPYCANDVQKASVGVVAHFSDLLLPLVIGQTVLMLSDETVRDVPALARAIVRLGTTRTVFVPSQLATMLEADGEDARAARAQLRCVIISGEVVTPRLVEQFKARLPHATLLNAYGASEAAGLACIGEVCAPSRISVGHAIAGTQMYIVSHHMNQVPSGEIGEICIAGEQLARGYLGDPVKTATKFVADPFGGGGRRMYRTGDLGRSGPDGSFEIVGRCDDEIKVRGFRVNLSEIECVLERHPPVEKAVVVSEDADGEKTLTAYIVGRTLRGRTSAEDIRRYARERLPDYMIPMEFSIVPEVPLLPNGKVDRQRLVSLHHGRSALAFGDGYTGPVTPIEATLAKIWSAVLKHEPIGPNDNFFACGGNSIRAMRVIARAASHGITITMRQLTEATTLGALAAVVTQEKAESHVEGPDAA
jgi:amino acid adenylation domain-containing protein